MKANLLRPADTRDRLHVICLFSGNLPQLIKNLLLLPLLLLAGGAFSQTPFITTWKTDNPGTSNSTSITIPTFPGLTYNYDVDWDNDGIYDQLGITGSVTRNFVVAGTRTIRIRGAFPRIYFNNGGDRQKLLGVSQWGTIAWTSMEGAFHGCSNLNVTATDVPLLGSVNSTAYMFADCTTLNGPNNIGSWNMATVNNMNHMFLATSAFNKNIGSWNTAAVTNMNSMFKYATAFNQPIGTWNTAAVTNMGSMFEGATAFNQPIGNWNTIMLTYTGFMFKGATAFNQPIDTWYTAAVTSMQSMFEGATSFNQSLNAWNTTTCMNMNSMFRSATAFNGAIGNWNTAAVTDMYAMFFDAASFNQNIGAWNTGAVTTMGYMFKGASTFNQPIDFWNTGAVTYMGSMFYGASAFNQTISNWNTANVTYMAYMFFQATSFNAYIETWNTANVTDMGSMFRFATAYNQPVGAWTLNANVSLANMFDNSGMNCTNYSSTLIGWSNNSLTPNNRTLGATGRLYESAAVAARTNLDVTKNWTFIGDAASPIFYADADGDGYGNPAISQNSCTQPSGYVTNNTDCDDNDAARFPGNPEICDNKDNNCNGISDDMPSCTSAGTRTWTGFVGTNWGTPCNWSPACVPTANDHVVIPNVTNDPIITLAGAVAKSVTVSSGGLLTIAAAGTLAINGFVDVSGNTAALHNLGTVANSGVLNIGGTLSVGSYGLLNAAVFNNQTGGQIKIDRSGATALFNSAGTFTNAATIIIGGIATVGQFGIQNSAIFNNNAGGGAIHINRSSGAAISNGTGTPATFENFANITIGAASSVGVSGIQNASTFRNNATGDIKIDNATGNGFLNTAGTFTNSGSVTLAATTSVGQYGIVIAAGSSYNSNPCASFIMNAPLNNEGTFTIRGLFRAVTFLPHINTATSIANHGILEYPLGNPIPGVTNYDVIVTTGTEVCLSTLPNALTIGTANSFTAGTTWYSDAGLTVSAGTYNPTTNTFTGTGFTNNITKTVYFTLTESGCTRTVSKKITFQDTEAPVFTCPSNQLLVANATCSATLGNYTGVSATDNCSPSANITISQSPSASSVLSGHGTTVLTTLTATDAAGNQKACNFNVYLFDYAAPVPNVPNLPTLTANCGVVNPPIPTATDNCSGTINATTTTPLPVSTPGTTLITWQYLDARNNVSTQTQTVNITCVDTVDNDGDGYSEFQGDCDDADPTKFPGNPEICDLKDNNCNGLTDDMPLCSSAGTRTWTGAMNSDWHTPCNWSPTCVPTLADHVVIPDVANDPIIGRWGRAKSLQINAGAVLTIAIGDSLDIDGGFTFAGASTSLANNGTFINWGVFRIGSATNAASTAITNNGGFLNRPGSECFIIRAVSFGIKNTGNFTNEGALFIGQSYAASVYALQNTGSFINTNQGEIHIDRTYLNNQSGTFTNSGNINIGSNPYTLTRGITNNGSFVNNAGGHIRINRTTGYAIENESGTTTATFTNAGMITYGAITGSGSCIHNKATFNNNAGGQIKIDNITGSGYGIFNPVGATFTNAANITIGATASTYNSGIKSDGNFNNNTGGIIRIDRMGLSGIETGVTSNPGSTFNNSGTIIIGANANVGQHGIRNKCKFNNLAGGVIQIDRCSVAGVYSWSGSSDPTVGVFTNSGTITAGANASIGQYGMYNRDGSITNNPGGQIHLDRLHPTLGNGVHNSTGGTIANGGAITIGAAVCGGKTGVDNTAIFNNLSGGQITIDNTTQYGCYQTGTLTNAGNLTIGATAGVGKQGIYNQGTVNNNAGGHVKIDRSSEYGFYNNKVQSIIGVLNNAGQITIGNVSNVGIYGIRNNSTMSNLAGGQIKIDRATEAGLYNFGGPLTNAGILTIGGVANSGIYGILNYGTFANNTGGDIKIDRTSIAAIRNLAINSTAIGNFTNNATVTIGTVASVGQFAISNAGPFTNAACAVLTAHAPLSHTANSYGSTFTNAGMVWFNTSAPHINASTTTVTNNGTIQYVNGNPIPNVVNNEIIAAPATGCVSISPVLSLGSPVDYTIATNWYKNATLTTLAGTYNQATNTFTNSSLTPGTQTNVYFAVTNTVSGCTQVALIKLTAHALPIAYAVTGGGAYCAGGSGKTIGLADSETGTTYQLKNGAANVGSPVTGTGNAISFGAQATPGSYTVVATKTASGCSATMTGSVSVVQNPLPITFTITGGGTYCAGGTGVQIGLDNSEVGVSYQLRLGTSNSGTPVLGTGTAISFGLKTQVGSYTIRATRTATGCNVLMSGTVTVATIAAPTAYAMTGGGAVCSGGAGLPIGLANSQTGITYQLMRGTTNVGTPVAGTAAALAFGNQNVAGTYTVIATNATTGCTKTMTGSAVLTAMTCGVPTALSATNITASSATVNWFNCGATGFQIQYRRLGTTTFTNVTTTTATLSSNLTGLANNTTYQYRVRAKCAGVYTAFTALSTFTTLSGCSNTFYTGATATNNSFTVNWHSVPGNTGQQIGYKLTTSASYTTNNVPVGNSSYTTPTNLLPNTAYHYRLRVKCGTTWFSYLTTQTITTAAPVAGNDDRADNVDAPTSVTDENSVRLMLSPNPTADIVTLSLQAEEAVTGLFLTDALGRVVTVKALQDFENLVQAESHELLFDIQMELDLQGLAPGVYRLVARTKSGNRTVSLVKI